MRFQKGVHPKNEFKKGHIVSPETRRKISLGHKGKILTKQHKDMLSISKIGKNNHNWKGGIADYASLHLWVVKWKGKPNLCEMCGTTKAKRFHWANIDHKYRSVLEDYIRMCAQCHKKYDMANNKGKRKLVYPNLSEMEKE